MTNEHTLADKSYANSERIGDWMTTYCKVQFYPLDPRPEEIFIEDIAHSLSLLCRYNGHCNNFYSVAEHSWLLSYGVPKEYSLEALLHDASEAYLGDVNRGLKYSETFTEYRKAEERLSRVIYTKFGLSFPESPIVKEFDSRIVKNESEVNLNDNSWCRLEPIPNITIECFSPKEIEQKFLARFFELTNINGRKRIYT